MSCRYRHRRPLASGRRRARWPGVDDRLGRMTPGAGGISWTALRLRISPVAVRKSVRNEALFRFWINFENAKRIAFWVDKIPLPAGIGDREFRKSHDAAELLDHFGSCVEILNFERANEGVGAALRWRSLR